MGVAFLSSGFDCFEYRRLCSGHRVFHHDLHWCRNMRNYRYVDITVYANERFDVGNCGGCTISYAIFDFDAVDYLFKCHFCFVGDWREFAGNRRIQLPSSEFGDCWLLGIKQFPQLYG